MMNMLLFSSRMLLLATNRAFGLRRIR